MSRPNEASNECEACGRTDAVAWMLENEKGELEALVLRCMWCGKWDFTEYISIEEEVIFEWDPEE